MRTSVKIEGLRELKAALEKLPSKATQTNVLKRMLQEAGRPVTEHAKMLAPDDPRTKGFDLVTSITVTQKLSRRQKSKHRRESRVEMFIGAGPLPQAHLQEFGNANSGPQPFLRPAWDSNKMKVLEFMKKGLWDEIDKAVQRMARKEARKAKITGR